MSNMSHCRFQNTLEDLRDCYAAMGAIDNPDEELSHEEAIALQRLVRLCRMVAEDAAEEAE